MVLPNFLVIGAVKAGTTSLHHYLKQHPEIYMSPRKEPTFFAFEGARPDFRGPRKMKAPINSMAVTEIEEYCKLFQGVSGEKAVGEVSPQYLYIPRACERIQHYMPDARLIAVLRNPVDRAYSSFMHTIRQGIEPLTNFREALQAERERIQKNWGILWHYTAPGFYYVQLKCYFERFNRDRIGVYLYDDFHSNPAGLMKRIYGFLEVSESFTPNMSIKYNVSGVPKNRTLHALTLLTLNPLVVTILRSLVPDRFHELLMRNRDGFIWRSFNVNLRRQKLMPEIRTELLDLYREDIVKLEDLIQRDLSSWRSV
jgi:hypothetical protein